MKNSLFWMVLIVGIVALTGSCKKSDDSTAAATAGCTAVSECSLAASGSITGLDNMSLSGTFNVGTKWSRSLGSVDNTTGCTSQSNLVSGFSSNNGLPEGTAAFTIKRVVTSPSSFAQIWNAYSDTSRSSEIATIGISYIDVTVGDNVTGLTSSQNTDFSASVGTTGTKVTYKESCTKGKATTDAGTTWLNLFMGDSSITWTTGTEQLCQGNQESYYSLWHVDNSSMLPNSSDGWDNVTNEMFFEYVSKTGYPTDWDISDHDMSVFPELNP